jgi:UDP-N-acetylmuramate dehydrogenase
MTILENIPLAPFTTLGIGGPATHFAEVTSVASLLAGVAWAASHSVPLFVLAGGSNIVVSDSGFRGLILRLSIKGIETRFDGTDVFVTAGAGEEWDALVEMCVENNWAGIECLSGIPGRVGATPIQNVGAYGQETSESFVSLDAFDTRTGQLISIRREDCEFGYRASRFRSRDSGRFIITSVTYRLTVNGKPSVRYAELTRYLDERGIQEPVLTEVRHAVLAIRRRKSMVIDANDPDSRSVGSFFMNPVVSPKEFEQINQCALKLTSDNSQMPRYPMPDGAVKLSAAWLIENAGFKRGYVHGNVGISTRHSLAIINRGNGTARELLELADEIRSRVRDAFGVSLSPEPIFVGFET